VSSSFLPGQTLYTANVATAGGGAAAADSSSPSLVLQVTSDGAQLLHSEGLTKLPDPRALWSAQSFTSSDDGDDVVGGGGGAAAITSACAAGSSVVVALRGGSLVALAVEPAAEDSSSVVLSKRASVTLENDIACLDVATGESSSSSSSSSSVVVVAVLVLLLSCTCNCPAFLYHVNRDNQKQMSHPRTNCVHICFHSTNVCSS